MERAPGTDWIGGWLGPRAVLDVVVKRKIPSPRRESNPRTPIVQPVAQRYTDWALTAFVCSVGPGRKHGSKTQRWSWIVFLRGAGLEEWAPHYCSVSRHLYGAASLLGTYTSGLHHIKRAEYIAWLYFVARFLVSRITDTVCGRER
jgi:hypothetical protein